MEDTGVKAEKVRIQSRRLLKRTMRIFYIIAMKISGKNYFIFFIAFKLLIDLRGIAKQMLPVNEAFDLKGNFFSGDIENTE